MRTSSAGGDLQTYLSQGRARVERALDGFLPDEQDTPARLHEAMRYAVFGGGKRLRPVLALAAFEVTGGAGDAVLAPACATELIHAYSLIHDDLPAMDDDDVRRGRPSCHRAFDEATAILAGDALLTLAFGIVAREERLSAGARVAIAAELAWANGSSGMVGGQMADMEGEGREPSLEAVEFIHTNKTARPIRAALVAGALAAGAGGPELARLAEFGEKIGLAFQVADDLLDVTGSADEMGKAVGKDGTRGKMTYPSVAGMEGASRRARELVDEALSAIASFGGDAWPLRELARFVVERRH